PPAPSSPPGTCSPAQSPDSREQCGPTEDLSSEENKRGAAMNAEWRTMIPACENQNEVQGFLERLITLHRGEARNSQKEAAVNAVLDLPDDDKRKRPLLRFFAALFWKGFEFGNQLNDLDVAIRLEIHILRLTPEGDPDKPAWSDQLSRSYERRYQFSGEADDIEESVRYSELALSLTPDDDLKKGARRNRLGYSYGRLFERLGRLCDLEKSISYIKQAMLSPPHEHPAEPVDLGNLGISYHRLFQRRGHLEDLRESISCLEQAILIPDTDTDKPSWLSSLGNSFRCRFERLDKFEDIEKSIQYHEQAVLLAPDGSTHKPACLNNLGLSLVCRFSRYGNIDDLQRSVGYLEQAAKLSTENDPLTPTLFRNLGNFYGLLFTRLGNPSDLEKAISYEETAMLKTPDNHPRIPELLNNLGGWFGRLFELRGSLEALEKSRSYQEQGAALRLGNLEDLERSINHHKRAVQLAADDSPSKAGLLSNLSASYQRMSRRLGRPEDIKASATCAEQAVHLAPSDHEDRPGYLSNLGNSYFRLFESSGKLGDLENGISCMEQAVFLTPEGHPSKPARLNNLGLSHQELFERFGMLENLDKAVSYLSQAVSLTPDNHPDKPVWLTNLGISQDWSFRRLGRLEDIEDAIRSHQGANLLTPDDHPYKAMCLHNLGNSYLSLYEQFGKPEDIEKAINYFQQALLLTPKEHFGQSERLSDLGSAYKYRFECLHALEDIQSAIHCQKQAVMLTPDGYLHKSGLLKNLALSYVDLFERLGQHSDRDNAIDCFRQATLMPCGHPVTKLVISRAWALSCTSLSASPLEAHKHSMTFLPQVVWLGISTNRRYEYLASDLSLRGLVTEAAASAISAQKCPLALEWLEEGRAIVWSQMLQLRTPFDSLYKADPDLAEQIKQVANDLAQASKPLPAPTRASIKNPTLDRTAQQRRRLAATWDELLDKARSLPGYHSFLQPKRFGDLTPAATSTTIVVINMDSSRCDAIVLLQGSMKTLHVPLPRFSQEKAVKAQQELTSSLGGEQARYREQRRPTYLTKSTSQDAFQTVLSTLWEDIAFPILEALGYFQTKPTRDKLPRITWCTTGVLAFLPLHAAGSYGSPGVNILDYVVSSYTPTLSSLIRPAPGPQNFHGILAVGQAAASGSAPLPGTVTEIDHLQTIATQARFSRLEGSYATTEAVLNAMQDHSWVHFACHASQNASDPNASAFQLHDGELSLAKITQKSLPYADFAFLSACQTAMGDENLPDEAVHLAAGMLMVGYSSVIATMWSIKDEDAPLVAEEVYADMLKGGVPDSRKAALALHKATESL
ncbi:hypothetical protein FRC06_004655, partial [Ceratobasidium sp. 370]